jgi:hypothetical protein
MKNIVIAGDSWGCGEWANQHVQDSDQYLLHKGVAQYLSDDNHLVINAAKGGISNFQAVERLKNLLDQICNTSKIDFVLFFQSEWSRDINFNHLNKSYVELKSILMSSVYYKLSELAQQYQLKIYLIGGMVDTIKLDNWCTEYPGTEILCQSMFNFVKNNHKDIDIPVHDCFLLLNSVNIEQLKSKSDLETLVDDVELANNRLTNLKNCPEFFWPDGVHANRVAHKKLYELINQTLIQ